MADGLPTKVVTHQLQVECRTAKAHRPKTDVIPLDHAANRKVAIGHKNQEIVITQHRIAIQQM